MSDGNGAGGHAPDAPATGLAGMPGPEAWPLLGWRGNALRFFSNPLRHMLHLRRRYGNVVRLAQSPNKPLMFKSSAAPIGTFFAFGPDNNRAITTDLETFKSRLPPGPEIPSFRRLASNFLFMNGERHTQQRRLIMPAFTRNSLRSYYDDMIRYTSIMLDRWAKESVMDIDDEMRELTMNIGSRSFYGLDPLKNNPHLAQLMVQMLESLFSPVTLVPVDLPGTPYRKLLDNVRAIEAGLRTEIEKKRRAGLESDDVLTMMVRAHDEDPSQLTDDELIGQSFVMFFAGHDTSAKALTWTLFLLAQHPRIMAELAEELETLGGDPPAFEQIFSLPYLDRVVKESLRILTPAVMFAREVSRPTRLGDHDVPAGSEVIYSPYVTHVDPEIYDAPKKFRPERWARIKPSKYEYLPFGAGFRTCLGVNFASIQLRLIIAMALQRFRFQVVPGTRIDLQANVVISPKKGMPMVVRAKDRPAGEGRVEVRGYVREMVDLD